ncbi:hypothetical protein [Pseudoclavibacter sp. CFCC 13611]|uniref:hypothetical protein n=1 Tax=Pseudoclavibacter sp. CFCC 13611 TaxID=2615178 RepID=UPI0013017A57|nr:hypothetical protein [Pseudoclavibacter sp. CFCC 13611]KAB1663077.1 hypothetical protein F8O08_04590 [Pseudoclavibacter sp. CFCC 13611]
MENIDVTTVAFILLIVAGSLLVIVVGLLLMYVVIREAVRSGTRTALREYEHEKAQRRAKLEREKRAKATAQTSRPAGARTPASAGAAAVTPAPTEAKKSVWQKPRRKTTAKAAASSVPHASPTQAATNSPSHVQPTTASASSSAAAPRVTGQTRAARRTAEAESPRSHSWTSWWSRSTRNTASPDTSGTPAITQGTTEVDAHGAAATDEAQSTGAPGARAQEILAQETAPMRQAS